MKTLKNPSDRLLAALGLSPKHVSYQRTCHNSTCCCTSHETGYSYIEVELSALDDVEVHEYAGSVSSHGRTVLREEYVEAHTARGLPKNAPSWAYTLESRRCDSGVIYTGSGVDVTKDGEFKIVKLMEAFKHGYREANLFATKDDVHDHTKQYRRLRFQRLRTERLRRFTESGLTPPEADRLFEIGKEQWAREQEPHLISWANNLRTAAPDHLQKMANSHSRSVLAEAANRAGVLETISGMSHPRATAFAAKALWVFHGEKTMERVDQGRAEVAPVITPFNSLAEAFAAQIPE